MKNYHRTDFSPKKKIIDKRRNNTKINNPIVGVYSTPDFYNISELNYWAMTQERLNDDSYYPYWAVNIWLIPGTFNLN